MNSKHSSDVVCLVCVRFLVLTLGEGYTFARQQNNSHSKEIGEYMEDGRVPWEPEKLLSVVGTPLLTIE